MKRKFEVFIVRSGLLGDTLVAIPSIRAIRAAYPQARITYVGERVPGTNYVQAADVLDGTELVDAYVYFYTGGFHWKGFVSLFGLVFYTLKCRPAKVFVLEAPGRYTRKSWFFRLLGRHVLASPPVKRSQAVNCLRIVHNEPSISQQLLSLVHSFGIETSAISNQPWRLSPTPQSAERINKWLHEKGIDLCKDRLIALGVWSNMPAKRWPIERYAEVIRQLLSEQSDLIPVILGGREEQAYGHELVKQWGKGLVAAGYFSIGESASLLAHSQLYIGNDTGTMHLAAAVGIPCVAIFSARDQPGKWHPTGANTHIVLRKNVPCAGCLLRECHVQQLRCLKDIAVSDVIEAVHKIFAHSHA